MGAPASEDPGARCCAYRTACGVSRQPSVVCQRQPSVPLGLVAFTSMQGASRRIRSQRAQSSAYLYATGPCMSARGFLGLPAGAVARGQTDVLTFLE